jgi:hypothetical protein
MPTDLCPKIRCSDHSQQENVITNKQADLITKGQSESSDNVLHLTCIGAIGQQQTA